MSEINNVNVNYRGPLQTTASSRPVERSDRTQAQTFGGKPLPSEAKPDEVRTGFKPSSAVQSVQEASRPEAVNRTDRPAESSEESLSSAVTQMNEFIQSTQRDLRFNIDRETGETIVKVIDRQTEEVIRQIPDELFLKLARHLMENKDDPVHLFNEQA